MIKVRVDWYHKCLGCGTEVVVDFDQGTDGYFLCPWCGFSTTFDEIMGDKELRDYLSKAAKEMEERANGKIALKR